MASYGWVKGLGIIAAVFSVYRGFTEAIPIEDLVFLIVIALFLISIANTMKARSERKANSKEELQDMKGEYNRLGEAISEKLGNVVAQ